VAKTDRRIRRLEKEIMREHAQDPKGEKLKQLRNELDKLLKELSVEKQPLPPKNWK